MSKIKTICAWCKTLIQDGDTHLLLGEERISHGICKKCLKKLESDDEPPNLDPP